MSEQAPTKEQMPFKPGEFVTDGATVLMVYEGDLNRFEHLKPWHERLESDRIWLSRRGETGLSGLVSRKISDLRRATCDEIFKSCVHGKLLGSLPCEACKERGIEQW